MSREGSHETADCRFPPRPSRVYKASQGRSLAPIFHCRSAKGIEQSEFEPEVPPWFLFSTSQKFKDSTFFLTLLNRETRTDSLSRLKPEDIQIMRNLIQAEPPKIASLQDQQSRKRLDQLLRDFEYEHPREFQDELAPTDDLRSAKKEAQMFQNNCKKLKKVLLFLHVYSNARLHSTIDCRYLRSRYRQARF